MPANSSERNPIAIAFGNALRVARTRTGQTQEALGLACEIDRTYISLLERGERQPTITTLFAPSEQLRIAPEVLITETRQALRKPRR